MTDNATIKPAIDQRRSLAFISAPTSFADDLELLRQYQAFSAELLRISLLGLSALGALIFSLIKGSQLDMPLYSRICIVIAALFFGLSTTAALAHRYCSSDSLGIQLEMIRYELRNRPQNESKNRLSDEAYAAIDRRARKRMFTFSQWALGIGSGALALGAITFALSISFDLLR